MLNKDLMMKYLRADEYIGFVQRHCMKLENLRPQVKQSNENQSAAVEQGAVFLKHQCSLTSNVSLIAIMAAE